MTRTEKRVNDMPAPSKNLIFIEKDIVFIENDVPPLQVGSYHLTATQVVPNQTPGTFTAQGTFVVQGERFSFSSDEIQSVFPPHLANGEFDGVMPHVVLNRRTLPWERALKDDDETRTYAGFTWLAVLLFDDSASPTPQQLTAKALLPPDASVPGTLPPNTLSYGVDTLLPLGFGETPDDPCTVIDIPLTVFNQIAPAAADVKYLAHIREVGVTEGVDNAVSTQQYAVILGNRIPALNTPSHAFMVSLENMADFLPDDSGAQSPQVPAGTQFVRLITYRYWTFTANNMDQTLKHLLENLNTPPPARPRITTLHLPIVGDAPDQTAVKQALAEQAAGQFTAVGATVLAQNALLMGYVPFNHHLRHGGQTFSWYRGPLAPYAIAPTVTLPLSTPDAANNYNPQTGLFDVSYGAAWQLGQLLALQNSGMANDLYQWKRGVTQQQAVAAEQALLQQALSGATFLESFLGARAAAVSQDPPPLPASVVDWFGRLGRLHGIPINYLVPDEGLLPPESIRFFYLDPNWMDALFDGAFSIGRSTTGEGSVESSYAATARALATAAARRQRPNLSTAVGGTGGAVTGFLMRSQAVAGWPNLRVKGFSDPDATQEIKKLRLSTLSNEMLLCLFDGVVASVFIREPPEQLHCSVGGIGGVYYTSLREVSDPDPGKQYTTDPAGKPRPCDPTGTLPYACITARADGQTLQVADAAASIYTRLTDDFGQTFIDGFTSAEFGLEMTEGVVEVKYKISAGSGSVTS
jgi:hypothetical protein